MASKANMTYKFFIVIDKSSSKPSTIAKNANEIAGEFFGELAYTLDIDVKGSPGNYKSECVARATIEAP